MDLNDRKITNHPPFAGRYHNKITGCARELQNYTRCMHCAIVAQGLLTCEEWWVTASQMDLPSQAPLSVAGWGRLMGVARRVTSVALLKNFITDPTNRGSRFPFGAFDHRRLNFYFTNENSSERTLPWLSVSHFPHQPSYGQTFRVRPLTPEHDLQVTIRKYSSKLIKIWNKDRTY